jgi:cysteine desulfurase family protein (TIGR01976 family)
LNRERFPGLADGWARLDAPAGAQPVDAAIDAIASTMRSGALANQHGLFEAGARTDALVASARAACGSFVGGDPRGVVFGPSMTTLTLAFSAAVGRSLRPGDEIVCTRLDHDANVSPWLIAAERAGATVRFAEPEPDTLELPAAAVEAVLSERTRWVAVTAASNAVGTLPDLPGVVAAAHSAGARVYVDAVHAAPHFRLDATELGADALVCSAYKFFGPHGSILWGRPELLEELAPDKLRPAPEEVPFRWETGTPAFEALAGIAAAAQYVQETGFDAIRAHEDELLRQMLDGLHGIDGVTVHGNPAQRAPTVMFSVARHPADEVARALAAERVAVWHGSYYAVELARLLGLSESGVVRAGVVHYNDASDVERLIEGVARLG